MKRATLLRESRWLCGHFHTLISRGSFFVSHLLIKPKDLCGWQKIKKQKQIQGLYYRNPQYNGRFIFFAFIAKHFCLCWQRSGICNARKRHAIESSPLLFYLFFLTVFRYINCQQKALFSHQQNFIQSERALVIQGVFFALSKFTSRSCDVAQGICRFMAYTYLFFNQHCRYPLLTPARYASFSDMMQFFFFLRWWRHDLAHSASDWPVRVASVGRGD